MPDGGTGRRWSGILMAVALLWSTAVPGAVAGELDRMRESQRDKLRAYEGRIAAIESQELAGQPDRLKRADKITRDRIARIRPALKSGDESMRLPEAAEQAWGSNGAERRMLRESLARLQRNLELAKENLARATEALGPIAAHVPESGVLEKTARIETAVSEVSERLSARWQREHDARERERQLREREAAERSRGVR